MSYSIREDIDHVLGKHYNVEYYQGNGKTATFNDVLTNVDGVYFWFSSEEDGLACVRQDRVTFMYCTDYEDQWTVADEITVEVGNVNEVNKLADQYYEDNLKDKFEEACEFADRKRFELFGEFEGYYTTYYLVKERK